MILPIFGFGKQVLRNTAEDIDRNYTGINELINNMFDTLKSANGVGLAAPQVGLAIRLFIIDTTEAGDDYPEEQKMKKTFINARIIELFGDDWLFNEGCLSVPDVREDIIRKSKVRIKYLDVDFNEHEDVFDGIASRVIQHEYDHLEGVLFIDKVSSLKKMLLKKKLGDISKGKIDIDYKMSFSVPTKKRK
jgi:peptide deformylase